MKKTMFAMTVATMLIGCFNDEADFAPSSDQPTVIKTDLTIVDKQDLNQQQILEHALGKLTLNYAQVFSHQQYYAGLEIARVNGYIMEIYQAHIKELDKQYCGEYFNSAIWMIPIAGGELNGLADEIAHECGDEFLTLTDDFLAIENEAEHPYRKTYHSELYERIELINGLVGGWLVGIKAQENE